MPLPATSRPPRLHARLRRVTPDTQHLERLLTHRTQLMGASVDARSHGLPSEAREAELLQHAVEHEIEDRFPDVYEAELAAWCEAEIRREHQPGELTACRRCRPHHHLDGSEPSVPLPAVA